jgi:hypothetical protein
MPLQCTMRPSGMEVIIRSLAPKQPKPPDTRWLQAFQPGAESPGPSLAWRETQRCWPPVAGLREPSRDRLRESSDWNESNPREVAATLDEVEPGADSISIFVAEAWVDKPSRLSMNLSRSLRGSAAEVFGFMSTRNRRKSPTPSAMQTHEPKMNVMP